MPTRDFIINFSRENVNLNGDPKPEPFQFNVNIQITTTFTTKYLDRLKSISCWVYHNS